MRELAFRYQGFRFSIRTWNSGYQLELVVEDQQGFTGTTFVDHTSTEEEINEQLELLAIRLKKRCEEDA